MAKSKPGCGIVVLLLLVGSCSIGISRYFDYREQAEQRRKADEAAIEAAAERLKFNAAIVSQSNCQRAAPPVGNASARGLKEANTANVANFELHGMRLYDSIPAIMVASKEAELSLWVPDTAGYTACVKDRISSEAQNRSWSNTPKNCINALHFKGSELDVSVNFVEDLPLHPGCMAVYAIDSERSDYGGGSGTLHAYQQALLTKYGNPDYGFSIGDSARWSTGRAELEFLRYRTGDFSLKLEDQSFKEHAEGAANQIRSDVRPTKAPKL